MSIESSYPATRGWIEHIKRGNTVSRRARRHGGKAMKGKEPENFREIVLADLYRAQRLIKKVNDEIDPQFRIATPDGDYAIAMTLSPDRSERLYQMRLVSLFMAWKLSPGFTMASGECLHIDRL